MTSSSLNIAMLGSRGINPALGGVEGSVAALSAQLAARGHRVTVYCRGKYAQGVPPPTGVQCEYSAAIYTKHLEAITHTFSSIASAARREFDVLHFHAIGPSLCVPIARASGKRTVVTVQGLDWQRPKWGLVARSALKVAEWTAARVPDHTIVVSRSLERYFRARYPGIRLSWIPNGVNPIARVGPGAMLERNGLSAGQYLLFLSRLVPEKGVHTLLQAYRDVSTDTPLVIAGGTSHSDDYVESLRLLAAKDARVQMVGAVHGRDKEELLSNALAYVHPSTVEGLPLALLEAVSLGIPSVVSDIAENLEVVTDLVTGEIMATAFRAGDVRSLTTALQDVLRDQAPIKDLAGRASVAVRDTYDWSGIADQVERVYRSLLNDGRTTQIQRSAV